MSSVMSSLTPGTVVNSCSTPSTRMLVTLAPGMEDSRVRRSELPEGVAESGLERLDDEPRAVLGDGFFGQCWALGNQHGGSFLSQVTIRYMTSLWV